MRNHVLPVTKNTEPARKKREVGKERLGISEREKSLIMRQRRERELA
jgi:hypothetical protein